MRGRKDYKERKSELKGEKGSSYKKRKGEINGEEGRVSKKGTEL